MNDMFIIHYLVLHMTLPKHDLVIFEPVEANALSCCDYAVDGMAPGPHGCEAWEIAVELAFLLLECLALIPRHLLTLCYEEGAYNIGAVA